jgi:predicted ATPase
MRGLPGGTVTFLFTDVEGSTRLLHELGSKRYAEALAEHRRALRSAVARHGGVEVDTQGDAFFVAFTDAEEALHAALEAQAALAEGPLRVRMGLHTGTPLLTEEGYVGVDVHTAARIAAAGHGGQVLVSEATRARVGGELRPLGAHRLKDLGPPQPLWQAGEGDFPPLSSLDQSNLPLQPTPFLGRERELGEVLGLLRRDDVRLLTLTGPGGSGKTRLAVQAAADVVGEYPHGVWWVPLQALRDASLVEPTIAAALGAKGELREHLSGRRLLLVLDNLEQLVEAGPRLAELLAASKDLKLLATSRERLRLAAEREFAVPPFVEQEAVGFFLSRARAARPDSAPGETAREICRRLDYLPLALELAAARLQLLSPEELLVRLERRLQFLTGGPRDAPHRQRTLRATIDWSHDLLEPGEQIVFRRLAVFAGGWTLASGEQVAAAGFDVLESLAGKSLVRHDDGRLSMLETIREYALERLEEAGESEPVRLRHAEFLLELAKSANLAAEADGVQRFDLVTPEVDNVRAALQWTLDSARSELGLRLAVALARYWVAANPFEAMRWFETLLESAGEISAELRAHALRELGDTTFLVGRFDEGARLFEESLGEFRRLGDEHGAAMLLHRLAHHALVRGELGLARSLAEESQDLSRRSGSRATEAPAITTLGEIDFAEGDHDRGLELMERGAKLAGEAGNSWWKAGTYVGLGERACLLRRWCDAEVWACEGLAEAHRIGERQLRLFALAVLARAAAETGRLERAGLLWGAVETEEAQGPVGQWESERSDYAGAVLAAADDEFEHAREDGRRLSLEDVVELALSGELSRRAGG